MAATIGYQETPGKQRKKKRTRKKKEEKEEEKSKEKEKQSQPTLCECCFFYRHTDIHANIHTIRMLLYG